MEYVSVMKYSNFNKNNITNTVASALMPQNCKL